MSLSFKFIPLTFLNDENEIKKQIRNTIILKYFFERNSEIVHLEDLITGTQYGYNASALVHGRNKFLRISDITDGKVNWETVPYCNCTDEETYLLFPNDILIARTGGTTGKSFLISEPPALSIYAGYLIRIRANEDTNPHYLNLFLNSYVYWSQIVSLNEDNFRPSVNANKLKKLVLPKCEKVFQDDAVKISNGELIKGYSDLYILIEETLLKYDKSKEIQFEKDNQLQYQNILKQCFLNEAIRGNLTTDWRLKYNEVEPATKLLDLIKEEKNELIREGKRRKEKSLLSIKSEEKPFDLPNKWEWCRLGDIFFSTSGGTPNRSNSQYWGGNISWYKSGELNDGYLDSKSQESITELGLNESSATLFPKGTLLIAMYGATAGKLAILGNNSTTNQAVCGLFENKFINTEYAFYYLMSQRAKMINESWGMSQPNISQTYLRNFLFPLPPFDEQIIIIEKIKTAFSNIDLLKNEIILSKKLSVNLMQAVLSDAFKICNNNNESLDSLFEDVNYSLYVAMIHKQIENRLKINYGEVATQKTVFNINAFTNQKIPYNFINSNHGTFSPQLKEDLSKNTYLAKDRKGNGEVFIINPSKQKEVLDALSNPKNKQFVRAVNEVLDIYELPFINKETDKIELLNTVAKLIIDYKTSDLDKIYKAMQDWEIKQVGFKTKAEKFSKMDTAKMIELIKNLNLIDKLF